MAWEIPGFLFSLPANADYSVEATYQFTPVRCLAATGAGINTGTAIAPVAATGDRMLGVMQNNPQLAEAATLMVTGITKALSGGVIAIGDPLMACPAGGFQKATSNLYQVGIALEAAVSGDIFTALLQTNGKV